MRKPYERDVKNEILEQCFKYLVENGLEGASINNLCKKTGMSSGSIYYWFKDKDEVFLDSAEYGLNKITDEVFNFAFKNINNISVMLESFPAKLMEHKQGLRFIFQLATSNQYGDRMRLMVDKLDFIYDAYAMKLSERLGCEYEDLQPFVYLFISSALDYIIWEDNFKMEKQLKALHRVMRTLDVLKEIDGETQQFGL